MKIGFGKHRDDDVEDVPSQYLRWMLESCDNLSDELIEEAEAELRYRKDHPTEDR